MSITIDDLEVRHTPEVEQSGPIRFAMLTPHAKQRNAVVNLGTFPEAAASVSTTMALDALEKPPIVANLGDDHRSHATTQAACHVAFRLGPRCHESRCQPNL